MDITEKERALSFSINYQQNFPNEIETWKEISILTKKVACSLYRLLEAVYHISLTLRKTFHWYYSI